MDVRDFSHDGWLKVLTKRPDIPGSYAIAYVVSTRHPHPSHVLELHIPGQPFSFVNANECPPPLLPGSLTSGIVCQCDGNVCG